MYYVHSEIMRCSAGWCINSVIKVNKVSAVSTALLSGYHRQSPKCQAFKMEGREYSVVFLSLTYAISMLETCLKSSRWSLRQTVRNAHIVVACFSWSRCSRVCQGLLSTTSKSSAPIPSSVPTPNQRSEEQWAVSERDAFLLSTSLSHSHAQVFQD